MAVTVQDVCRYMEAWADPAWAEDYDNPGLLLGHRDSNVRRILTALDATEAVVAEAVEWQADLIVTHHPMILRAIKKIEDGNRQGRRLLTLAENRIALYSAHTNLDCAVGGTNDVMAEKLGLQEVQILPEPGKEHGFLRMGRLLQVMSVKDFAALVKKRLDLEWLRIVAADMDRPIHKVALCTGAGNRFVWLANQYGADAYITGDISYHEAEEAIAEGIALIDAGHFGTEVLIAETIARYLSGLDASLEVRASSMMRDAFITI